MWNIFRRIAAPSNPGRRCKLFATVRKLNCFLKLIAKPSLVLLDLVNGTLVPDGCC